MQRPNVSIAQHSQLSESRDCMCKFWVPSTDSSSSAGRTPMLSASKQAAACIFILYSRWARERKFTQKNNKTAAAIVYCYWTSNCTTAVFELSSLICEQLIEVLCVFLHSEKWMNGACSRRCSRDAIKIMQSSRVCDAWRFRELQ